MSLVGVGGDEKNPDKLKIPVDVEVNEEIFT